MQLKTSFTVILQISPIVPYAVKEGPCFYIIQTNKQKAELEATCKNVDI